MCVVYRDYSDEQTRPSVSLLGMKSSGEESSSRRVSYSLGSETHSARNFCMFCFEFVKQYSHLRMRARMSLISILYFLNSKDLIKLFVLSHTVYGQVGIQNQAF